MEKTSGERRYDGQDLTPHHKQRSKTRKAWHAMKWTPLVQKWERTTSRPRLGNNHQWKTIMGKTWHDKWDMTWHKSQSLKKMKTSNLQTETTTKKLIRKPGNRLTLNEKTIWRWRPDITKQGVGWNCHPMKETKAKAYRQIPVRPPKQPKNGTHVKSKPRHEIESPSQWNRRRLGVYKLSQ